MQQEENYLAQSISQVDADARYDEGVKRLLANKSILAVIMKECVPEYHGCTVREIAEKYIEGEPQIGAVGVDADETNRNVSATIHGTNTEDVTLTEAKGIPLAYEMARQSGKYWIPARKGPKLYMREPVIIEDQSITTAGKQTLVIDKKDIEYMDGKRILIVDDVISTGGSLHALETLAAKSTGTVVGCCAALAEGDAAKRTDIFFLEPLPLFLH